MESQSTHPVGIILSSRAVPSVSPLDNVRPTPFPELRTIQWMVPDPATTDKSSIVITSEVLLQTSYHVAQTLAHEIGGFLLGNRHRCPNTRREYIIIDQYIQAEFTEATPTSLTLTPETWGRLDDHLTGKHYGKELLGWYHSHPNMSVFLSGRDLHIHKERFFEPWMVALVLEPKKHRAGFFVWDNGNIDPNRFANFYELLAKGQNRETVVAWKNYKGLDPITGKEPPLSASNTMTPPVTGANLPRRSVQSWVQGHHAWLGTAALGLMVSLITLIAVYGRKRPPEMLIVQHINSGQLEKVIAGVVPDDAAPDKKPEEPAEKRRSTTSPVTPEEIPRRNKARQEEQAQKAWQAKQDRLALKAKQDRLALKAAKNAKLAAQATQNKAEAKSNTAETNAQEIAAQEKKLGDVQAKLFASEGKLKRLEAEGKIDSSEYRKEWDKKTKLTTDKLEIISRLNELRTSN